MDERVLGANIRAMRERAGLTVTALAQRAELTKGGLSKIETGRASPPISTLMRIADALGVPLASFFEEPETDPPFVLTRKGQGRIITRDGTRFGYSYEALALEMRHKRIEPFLLTIRPGDPPGSFRHGGQEFIYMLAGRLQFTVGSHTMVLRPGDSLYFDPTLPHSTRVMGKRSARFLCVFVQEDSSRLAARPRRRRPGGRDTA